MAVRPAREVISALTSKGFVRSNNDHKKFILYINNQKTNIRTKVSHGRASKDLDSFILSSIKKQIKLDTISQLCELIDCTLSGSDYLKILKINNKI